MKLNFETFFTKLKATFDTMKKYGEGIYEQEKVSTVLDNIGTTNQNLEFAITFCRFNQNGNYLIATKYLNTKSTSSL